MSNLSRRETLSAFPVAALALTAPASALAIANDPDAEIRAAWERVTEARDTFDLIHVDGDTPAERETWRAIDEAEDFIQSATAKTPEGVAIQLWVALGHTIDTTAQDEAVKRRDLQALAATAPDWNTRCIIAALRSLEGMA